MLIRALSAGADIDYFPPWYRMRYTALDRAWQHGHIAIVTELLKHNPPLDEPAWDNHTPLNRAAFAGHQAVVDLLLAAGSDPNTGSPDQTLLIAAITSNLEATAIAFLYQTTEDALHELIERCRLRITELMFARGIAATVSPPLDLALASGLKYVKLCLAHGAAINAVQPETNHTALHLALCSGQSDIIEYLLQQGADPDACPCGDHPLLDAVNTREPDIVRSMLQHGVDLPRLWNADVNLMGDACERGPRAIVEVLLDAFDRLGMSDSVLGDSALLRGAVDYGQVDVVKLLLERGAEVDARIGIEQETALYRAVKAGEYNVVEALLEGGADPAVVCGGKTIMACAVECGADKRSRRRIVAALRRVGADIV